MEIRDLLEIGRKKLLVREYLDPIKEAVYILSKVLDKDKSFLYTNLDKWLDKEEEDKFLQIIDRRAAGEPMAYIFKTKEFMGIDFFLEEGSLNP